MNLFKSPKNVNHVRDWIIVLILFALSAFTLQINPHALQTNVLGTKQHAPFDGTALPVQQIPDWSHVTGSEAKMNFHDFPASKLISTPQYNNDYLTFPSSSLVWGNSSQDVIRNTKITFPVAYAGNYELNDSGENSGSHPAVDIKALKGTPVYSVANGIVTKTSFQSGGFGYHIVIGHNDVPKPNSRNSKVDLFSSYSHLSKIFVSEGEVVRKGQVIGEVGDSGTATTPHLHFQLDSSLAPWHPYWPFTSTEASNAGYDFWSAINKSLNQGNVFRYTYNPMNWVQENLSGTISSSTTVSSSTIDEPDSVTTVTPVTQPDPITNSDSISNDKPVISSVVKLGFNDVSFSAPDFLLQGTYGTVSVTLVGSDGKKISSPDFDGNINVHLSDNEIGNLNRDFLSKADFKNGIAELKLYAEHEGQVKIIFEHANRNFESNLVSFISSVQPFARFGIDVDGRFTPGIEESVIIRALDFNGNPTPSFNSGGKIVLSTKKGGGTFSKSELTADDFHNGVAEVFFYGEGDEDVIIQSLYGKAKAESSLMKVKLFSDVSSADPTYAAISFLFKKGTIQGYPDGTFKPGNTVSRVEALKLIFSGMDKEVQNNVMLNFKDTSNQEWYAPYVATAKTNGIVTGYPDGSFKPSQGVNRVEFLKMLFATTGIQVDPVVPDAPYDDVNELSWFAPYVQYAKANSLFPVDGNRFFPNNPMNRSEVAEVLYRLIMAEKV